MASHKRNTEMNLSELFEKAIAAPQITIGNETQVTILEEASQVFIALQGSVELQDWKYNFDFWAAPYKNMPVKWYAHQGFVKCWKEAEEEFAKLIEPYVGKKPIILLGYSHGAALALLAYEYLRFHDIAAKVYCFGCPRVLWFPRKEILARFEDAVLVRRRGDLVTHVPFAWMGYRHAARLTKVGKPRLIWWKRHLIAEYREALA